jgi:hypothetical protein
VGEGYVFKLDTSRNFSVIYDFLEQAGNSFPLGGVVLDAAGNLYGAISGTGIPRAGSPCACGYVYQIDPKGNQTVLCTFTGESDGSNPASPLTLDATGHLYGTAAGLVSSYGL